MNSAFEWNDKKAESNAKKHKKRGIRHLKNLGLKLSEE